MRRILLVLLIFLTGCSSDSKKTSTPLNLHYDQGLFRQRDHIIYQPVGRKEWYNYDIKNDITTPFSVKVTEMLKVRSWNGIEGTELFAHSDGIYALEMTRNIETISWNLSNIPNNSAVPRAIADTKGISLIDARTFSFLTKTGGDYLSENNIYSPDLGILESNHIQYIIPYDGYMYQVLNYGLIRTDFFGNNFENLNLNLNARREEISFIGDDIYYLDAFYDVRKYDTSSKEDRLVIEDVYMFEIDDKGIYYTSLKDSSFNYFDFKTKKKTLLTHEIGNRMKTDFKYIYYLGGFSGFDLYRVPVNGGDSELLHSNCIAYLILENSIFIMDTYGDTKVINK